MEKVPSNPSAFNYAKCTCRLTVSKLTVNVLYVPCLDARVDFTGSYHDNIVASRAFVKQSLLISKQLYVEMVVSPKLLE